MRYLGGKSRLAKPISDAILAHTSERGHYLEPFIGGGSVFAEMVQHFDSATAADAQEDLALLWRGLIFGTFTPPTTLTESEWRCLRDAEPSALRGFAGYGCSFGGRFFEGYARNKAGTNYAAQTARSLARDLKRIDTSKVRQVWHSDYRDFSPRAGTVVYCDPPYANTKHYASKRSGLEAFDHAEFWRTMDSWIEAGAEVFVSEFTAPDHWVPIWEKDRSTGLGTQSGAKYRKETDRLFTRGAP